MPIMVDDSFETTAHQCVLLADLADVRPLDEL